MRRQSAGKSVTCPRCRRNVLVTVKGLMYRHPIEPRKGAPLCDASELTYADALAMALTEVAHA